MTYIAHLDPDRAEREAERRTEARADGEPMTERDWDQWESSEGWNYPGGVGPRGL